MGQHQPPRAKPRFSTPGRLHALVERGAAARSRRDLVRAAAVLATASVSIAPGVRAGFDVHEPSGSGAIRAQDAPDAGAQSLALPFNPFGQPLTIDPHRTVNWGPFWALLPHVWSGLLRFDENGAVVPDLAERIEPQEDASIWIATLRPDLRFASGRPVVAQHFVDSWMRALDPVSPSPMAQFMNEVDGYDAFVSGASSEIGFSASDDRTIEIRLGRPVAAFPSHLATFVWAVLDPDVLADPETPDPFLADAGAGQWRFTELIEGERLVMEPNPEYWDDSSPTLSRVTWRIVDGPDAAATALELYRNDEVALADVPFSLYSNVREDATLSAELRTIESPSSTLAIGMDFNQQPFDDVRVRQAVAASIDRERWATELTGGEFQPARSLVPPSVSLISGYDPASPIETNPDRARQLVSEAGLEPGMSVPDIVHYQPADASRTDLDRHAALLAMIEENSGLVIRHDTTLTAEQIAATQADNGGRQFDIVWWWSVTESPSLLETAGSSRSPYMTGWFNWSAQVEARGELDPGAASSEFDALVSRAGQELDQGARNEAYRAAEQLLLDNAVLIPLGHWTQRFVQKPWLMGTRQGPWTGSIPIRFDRDVKIEGRP